ncbi:hypothetical protein H0G86_011491 [Trichoderma simmonsii]|uniref:Uncharacterized protein n=1 Tax=Trichoderma simmonsii TaxID=1491479 RepID=A0A8G0LLP3_9HYPO|nr:hypothetical protein H0G86_011491 [Trichoderma simmonsii]
MSSFGNTASMKEETDPFSFNIQLNTEEENRGFHGKNYLGEVQRHNVIDDCCLGLLLKGRIDRIIHGWETEGGNPATLVIFGFRFHGISEARRFKQATITITFQDEKKREDADPEVIAMWPDGDFTLGRPTQVTIGDSQGAKATMGLSGGPPIQPTAQATLKWERKKEYTKESRASLTGSTMLNMAIRDYGGDNAAYLTIREDSAAASGIITDFRVAVLLRRQNQTDRFSATVSLKAKAHFFYNAIRVLRDISGFSPANDPVVFQPGVQYLRVSNFLNDELADGVDERNLTQTKLEGLAGVLGTTVLSM